MDLYILFGQRKVRYEGEYAPEALEVITEYGNDENPDFMLEEQEKAIQSGEFTNVQVLRIYVNDRALDNAMNPVSIHGAIRLDNKRLPEPAGILVLNGQALRAFTADQMHDYAGTAPVPPGAE